MQFKNRLKQLRTEKDISQTTLGIAFEVPKYTICNWERGRGEPDTETLKKLAIFFDVTCDCLLGLED